MFVKFFSSSRSPEILIHNFGSQKASESRLWIILSKQIMRCVNNFYIFEIKKKNYDKIWNTWNIIMKLSSIESELSKKKLLGMLHINAFLYLGKILVVNMTYVL